jgi:threonine synthase
MIVSHPSNLARLIDFYGGHMYDERDASTDKIIRPGVIDRMPDMDEMRRDIVSMGVTNTQHFETMKDVFEKYGVILDPHGAVGWRTLDIYLEGHHDDPAVIYETADPGKFPEDVERAIGLEPDLPPGMQRQASQKERIYSIESAPEETTGGLKLSKAQIDEAKAKIKGIFQK